MEINMDMEKSTTLMEPYSQAHGRMIKPTRMERLSIVMGIILMDYSWIVRRMDKVLMCLVMALSIKATLIMII